MLTLAFPGENELVGTGLETDGHGGHHYHGEQLRGGQLGSSGKAALSGIASSVGLAPRWASRSTELIAPGARGTHGGDAPLKDGPMGE